MTLLIAWILMNHVGGFDSEHYALVIVLWIMHLMYHNCEKKK